MGAREDKRERQNQLNRELHAAFLSGDELALEELIRINKGLAGVVVSKYMWATKVYQDIDIDDIDQAAMIGLWQGVIKWDPEKGELSQMALWMAGNEIRRMIWKRQRCREDKVLLSETSTFRPIPGTDDLMVSDSLKDPSALPDEQTVSMERCQEFFHKLDELNPMPADVEALKDFVYRDWPPKDPSTFRRIKNLFKSNTRTREWVREWLDLRTTFIRSQAFDRQGTGRRGSYSDPTAQTVIERERLETRLERLLEGVH